MRIVFFFCSILFFSLTGVAGESTKEEREILQIQNQRQFGSKVLYSYLQHPNEQVRTRALIAIANIEDTIATPQVIELLHDRSVGVRVAAMFALGYIAPDTASPILFQLFMNDSITRVQRTAIEVLGEIGTQEVLEQLAELNVEILKPELREALALSYARFAMRGLKTERMVWHCFDLLKDTSTAVQWKALYALCRLAPYDLVNIEVAKHEEELLTLVRSYHPYVRMFLAQLLGRTQGEYRSLLLDSLENYEVRSGNDWRVLINLVKARAVQVPRDSKNLTRFVNTIHHINPYVRITALQHVGAVPSKVYIEAGIAEAVAKELTELITDSTEHVSIRGEALVTLGKLFPLYFDARDSLWVQLKDVTLQRKRIEALAQSISQHHIDTLVARMTDPNVRVAMAAWDFSRNLLTIQALRALQYDSARAMQLVGIVCENAQHALKRNDLALTTIIADLASTTNTAWLFAQNKYKQSIQTAFIDAYEKLSVPEGYEARRMILRALRIIGSELCVPFLQKEILNKEPRLAREALQTLVVVTKKEQTMQPTTVHVEPHPLNWKLYETLPPRPKIEFRTTNGSFTLELLKEVAPATTLSMVELVQKKFYDGLTFHRVVPGFVVQGGDPRGDGWGGPGYTIRTEVFPEVSFEEGYCGMASAGKDTEGSQFFITQAPAPHLDGRYTMFGRVVRGMDVVQSLMVGDTILSAKLVE